MMSLTHIHTHTNTQQTHTHMHTHTHTHTHSHIHLSCRVLVFSKQDEEVLLNGGWLTATHIAAVHNLLRKTFPNQEGLNDTSVLSEKLKWPSNPTKFVQIIHLAGCHWACLSNLYCEPGAVDLYNSLHTSPAEKGEIVKQECAIMQSDRSTISIDVQCQMGASDCGLFAAAMAFDLCLRVDPFLRKYDQEKMRKHLMSCFKRKEVVCFPRATLPGHDEKSRVVKEVTTEIFCICRLSEEEPMACCNTCGIWFHENCVKIPKEVFDDEIFCCRCTDCKFRVCVCVLQLTDILL